MWEHPWVAHVGLLFFFFFFFFWHEGYFWFGWLSLSSVFADHHPFDVGVKVHGSCVLPRELMAAGISRPQVPREVGVMGDACLRPLSGIRLHQPLESDMAISACAHSQRLHQWCLLPEEPVHRERSSYGIPASLPWHSPTMAPYFPGSCRPPSILSVYGAPKPCSQTVSM